MPYALSVAQISTVKEAINPELIAHAYLLTDSMFGDLGMMVTTDVENIQTCYLFNRKGLQARPYFVGNVKDSELGKFVDNPAKVEKIYLHTSDSIERYTEKGPFDVTNVTENTEHTQFLLNTLSGNLAEDVRANIPFGNMAYRKLEETPENAVKKGLSLFNGFYTIIAMRRTDGTISEKNGNLIPTGDITNLEADQVYDLLVNFYGKLSPALKDPNKKLYIIASDEFCRKAVKGYMITFPQISPTVLQAGWKFAEMPNVVLATSAALGTGGQLVATLEKNIEYICDKREDQALISIGQVNKDLRVFDFQANVRATVRIRDFDPQVFAVNDVQNVAPQMPAGEYLTEIFTAVSENEKMGTVQVMTEKELFQEGDLIQVKATPKKGYIFVNWSDGGTSETYNFTFPGGVYELKAKFMPATEAGNGGSGDGGAETPTYTAVSNPSGNPSEKGWYEKSGDVYSLTEDTAVVEGKTYYTKG